MFTVKHIIIIKFNAKNPKPRRISLLADDLVRRLKPDNIPRGFKNELILHVVRLFGEEFVVALG